MVRNPSYFSSRGEFNASFTLCGYSQYAVKEGRKKRDYKVSQKISLSRLSRALLRILQNNLVELYLRSFREKNIRP